MKPDLANLLRLVNEYQEELNKESSEVFDKARKLSKVKDNSPPDVLGQILAFEQALRITDFALIKAQLGIVGNTWYKDNPNNKVSGDRLEDLERIISINLSFYKPIKKTNITEDKGTGEKNDKTNGDDARGTV
jgi:hypothetical protein